MTDDNDNSLSATGTSSLKTVAEDESNQITENDGYKFWKETLQSSRFILAPMVDQSELAFRLFVRRHRVQCTYTPMFNSNIFVKDVKYRRDCLQVLPELDRPLIVQFCANNAETFLRAAEMSADYCDAIDLNLGCPQTIAKRGHYGAFLQDEWDLIYSIVNLAAKKVNKPITCKIRVFDDLDKTIRYARMVESAGASLLTVHGRNREQKGASTGMANWDFIKAVKNSVKIPVFANGNIQSLKDIENCLEYTGCDGVMTAEGILHNPAIFTGRPFAVWDATREYVELARQHPCPFSYVRGHVFKFLHHCLSLPEHEPLRTIVAKTHSLDDMIRVADELEEIYRNDYEMFLKTYDTTKEDLIPDQFPIFCCKPFYRPPPTEFNTKMPKLSEQDEESVNASPMIPKKRGDQPTDDIENEEKKKRRKLESQAKFIRKQNQKPRQLDLCSLCPNPKGLKCDLKCCKQCCKVKASTEILDCKGHRFVFQTRQLKLTKSTEEPEKTEKVVN